MNPTQSIIIPKNSLIREMNDPRGNDPFETPGGEQSSAPFSESPGRSSHVCELGLLCLLSLSPPPLPKSKEPVHMAHGPTLLGMNYTKLNHISS
jgi:hypothetical protein